MGLQRYQAKRDFRKTPEPRGHVARKKSDGLSYLIQKHAASRLHYDFRLELDGVLLSWAVPKGPSVDPADKRLAMHVEDHPVEYGGFEGIIPKGEYGGGTVMIWDRGTWVPIGDPREGYRKGHLKFALHGEKLRGRWALSRTRGRSDAKGDPWLLIKDSDEYAQRGNGQRIVEAEPDSIASGRDLEEIAESRDREWHSDRSTAENVRAGAIVPFKRSKAKTPQRGAQKAAARRGPPEGAKRSAMSASLSPTLATLVD